MNGKKIIVAVTGASGSLYAARTLGALLRADGIEEITLIVSDNGRAVMEWEQVTLPDIDIRDSKYGRGGLSGTIGGSLPMERGNTGISASDNGSHAGRRGRGNVPMPVGGNPVRECESSEINATADDSSAGNRGSRDMPELVGGNPAKEYEKAGISAPAVTDTAACVRLMEYANSDMFAPPASGSADYDAMVIVPCSMGTLGRIASGVSSGLIERAADVMLKERRPLILVTRETPLSTIHLRNMTALSECGAVVLPASPSFYSHPGNIEELCDTVVERIMKMLGISSPHYRWGEK